jgi:hypothetical protein
MHSKLMQMQGCEDRIVPLCPLAEFQDSPRGRRIFLYADVEEPLLAALVDEFLKSDLRAANQKLRLNAGSLSETGDGRCDAVRGRDGTVAGTKVRTK